MFAFNISIGYTTIASNTESFDIMKMRKTKYLVLIILAVVLTFNGCTGNEMLFSQSSQPTDETTTVVHKPKEYEYDSLAQRNYLSDEDKEIYDGIYDAVMTLCPYKAKHTSSDSEEFTDKVWKILQNCVLTDHPEIFWTDGGGTTSWTVAASTADYTFEIKYLFDEESIHGYSDRLKSCLNEALAQCPGGSDYDKALWAYEWIINNSDYDINTTGPLETGAYGILCYHKSTCNGYSKAYQMLLQNLGIPCTIVSGKANNGTAHGWNVITIESQSYHVDVTWGDPTNPNDKKILSHEYFCLSDDEIKKSRTINDSKKIPECNSTKHNYYVYNSILVKSLNNASVKKAIKFACEQGYDTAEIKFADRELYKKGVQKYVNEEKIFPILAQLKLQGYKIESGISLYYTENEDINTLTIDLKSSDD